MSPYTGKKVAAKKRIGNPCTDGCFDKVTMEGVRAINDKYWESANYDIQNAYLLGCIKPVEIKRKRTTAPVSKRKHNFVYSVMYNGKATTVCRKGFLAIHGLTNSKIDYVVGKKQSPTGTPIPDKRGKQTPANKITGTLLERVHEHIRLLPVTSSHYTRAKSPHRKYLPTHESVKSLYLMYKDLMMDQYPDEPIVKQSFYEHIFTSEYNIAFAPPQVDECDTCVRLKSAIDLRKHEGNDTSVLEAELLAHSKKQETARNYLNALKLDRNPNHLAVCIDLQQTIPCPKLSVGSAYYKRKLWLYNFCIHNLKSGISSMYLWDETVAGRGSIEIASCLNKWRDNHFGGEPAQELTTLSIFADNCAGQNKNLQMVLFLLREIHSRRLTRVELSFLVSGHSFMPCDRSFGVIEKEVRGYANLYTPHDFKSAILRAQTPPFPVCFMTSQDFFDYTTLSSCITKRSASEGKFSKASQIVVDSKFPQGYLLKDSFGLDDDAATKVRLSKGRATRYRRSNFDLSAQNVPLKYAEPRLLLDSKVNDLASLLIYYPDPAKRTWLQSLVDLQRELLARGTGAQATQEDVDPESVLQDYDSLDSAEAE